MGVVPVSYTHLDVYKRQACTCPEMAAAVAVLPGGQPFKDLKFHTGPDYYASTKGLRIPGIFIGGTADVASYPAPWILDNKKKDYRVHNLDIWMRDIAQIKNYRPLSSAHMEELLANSQDPVEREFGLEFDISYNFHVQGADWLDVYKRQHRSAARGISLVGSCGESISANV